MTLEETVDVLNIIKLAYPNFYGTKGAADLDKREICKLWATMFAEDDFDSVLAAVKTYIATDTTGFGPTVGQLKDLERRLTHREAMTEAEAWGLVSKAISNGLYGAGEEFAKLPRSSNVWSGLRRNSESGPGWTALRSRALLLAISRELFALPRNVKIGRKIYRLMSAS